MRRPDYGTVSAGVIPLNESDTDLGIVTPDSLACSSDCGLARPYKIERKGNAGCGLKLKASAYLGDIPNRAWDRVLSEKDFAGLQHTLSRSRLPSVHERYPPQFASTCASSLIERV
jgi:hypothetical protein